MSPKLSQPHRQPQADRPEPWQPEDNEDAWERVLDCGAPGPARAAPALFYQAGHPPAQAGDRHDPD